MNELPAELQPPLIDLLLAVADDKLMLGSRNSDWTGLAPLLEEDIAFSAMAQDEIGHAATLYQLIAPWLYTTADKLAYGRRPEEYRCAAIVEAPDDFDWAVAIVRQFFCDNFDGLRLARLARSAYEPLAKLAARLLAEERIHVAHADSWLTRLGRGGDESRTRMQAALDRLAPLAPALFEPTRDVGLLESAGIYPVQGDMFARWRDALHATAREAGLHLNLAAVDAAAIGGRRGRHSADFVPLLTELTEVYALEPDGAW
jgi:ring-1,2-phenylacetyl-CoA epoxidase subunit PaaC